MTEQTQPTDAELIDVWAQFVGDPTPKLPLTDADKVAFARAVLAKWGTPAGAGEVAGRVYSANCEYATVQWLKQTSDVGGGDPKNSRSWPISGDAVYLAPQPTQAQAVNQADRPFVVRLAEDFAEECVTAGYVTTKAASYGRLMDEALSTQAQAGAVPLTVQYPEGYGNPFAKIAYDAGWRAAEHAHGIKGADHER